jgi:hypothetical protein
MQNLFTELVTVVFVFILLFSSQYEYFIFKPVPHYNIIIFHIMLSTSSKSNYITLSSATSSCSSSCYSFSLVNPWSNTLPAIQTPHNSTDCHTTSLHTAKYVICFLHLQEVSVHCHIAAEMINSMESHSW